MPTPIFRALARATSPFDPARPVLPQGEAKAFEVSSGWFNGRHNPVMRAARLTAGPITVRISPSCSVAMTR